MENIEKKHNTSVDNTYSTHRGSRWRAATSCSNSIDIR